MEQTYSQVRLAYEEARERRSIANNYPTDPTEQRKAEVHFVKARLELRAFVEAKVL